MTAMSGTQVALL